MYFMVLSKYLTFFLYLLAFFFKLIYFHIMTLQSHFIWVGMAAVV